jgi:AbrB family looped-hinge helix DNA binding protein
MTNRVGPKGQVVIPQHLRIQLGIKPGDEVIFWLEGDQLRAKRFLLPKTLRGRWAGSNATEEYMAEKRRDLEKEERGLKRPRSSGTA